jgi:septal ring factor EnvC (AmiA/AmiB activator)
MKIPGPPTGFRALAALIVIQILLLPAAGEEPADRSKPVEQHESKIRKLQNSIKIHLGELQIVGEKEFQLLEEIERIDRELSLQKVRLDVMRERQATQQVVMEVKLRELESARAKMGGVRQHLQSRLRAYYLMGRTGLLNVIFSTRTLPELMLINDAFTSLLEHDLAIVNTYRQAIDRLSAATEEHDRESRMLTEYIAETVEGQGKLDAILDEKKALLKKVKTRKVLHEQALREMRKAEQDLGKTLVDLQRRKAVELRGFDLKKGDMPPPVSGTLVQLFGREDDNGVISSGIAIDARDGSTIRAISAGRVIFAGYRQGYGNTVIIDHGGNYSSITARMEKITVKEGDDVGDGHTIGLAGDIATLFARGVYFEIRQGADPLDPLEWITGTGLAGTEAPGRK